jgi:ubiquinone/menaquinone biosynthesis C-methylase UbiE
VNEWVESPPYPDDSFDCAFAIHCIYFWPEPVACLREMRRVLRPDGVVAITIRPVNQWPGRKPPADVFHLSCAHAPLRLCTDGGSPFFVAHALVQNLADQSTKRWVMAPIA